MQLCIFIFDQNNENVPRPRAGHTRLDDGRPSLMRQLSHHNHRWLARIPVDVQIIRSHDPRHSSSISSRSVGGRGANARRGRYSGGLGRGFEGAYPAFLSFRPSLISGNATTGQQLLPWSAQSSWNPQKWGADSRSAQNETSRSFIPALRALLIDERVDLRTLSSCA